MTDTLVSFTQEGHIGTITLHRPESLNAISGALADDLTVCMRKVAVNEDVWVVVLAAEGEKAFCVGADLKERSTFSLPDYYDNRERMRAMAHRTPVLTSSATDPTSRSWTSGCRRRTRTTGCGRHS